MNAVISSLVAPLAEIVGRFIPDPEKKAAAQLQMLQMAQNGELAQLNAALQVILAEERGNWLQRTWRPLLMVFFAALVGARWFGFTPPNMAESEILKLWDIVQFGIGGYTIGRSFEKVIPPVIQTWNK